MANKGWPLTDQLLMKELMKASADEETGHSARLPHFYSLKTFEEQRKMADSVNLTTLYLKVKIEINILKSFFFVLKQGPSMLL